MATHKTIHDSYVIYIQFFFFKIEKIKQLIYFGINRWDVILNDGKVVKLPAENYEASIKKFLSIYKKENFVNFKIFDFRIKGQLILK